MLKYNSCYFPHLFVPFWPLLLLFVMIAYLECGDTVREAVIKEYQEELVNQLCTYDALNVATVNAYHCADISSYLS